MTDKHLTQSPAGEFVMFASDEKNYKVQYLILPLLLAVGYRVRSVRDIRASERLRVREIFALVADYQPSLKETTLFFQTIQNKLHFACTGHTSAELIHQAC